MMSDHQWPEAMRKRAREEEEDNSNCPLGFTEHRNKRLQSLPLRTSPNQPHHKRWTGPLNYPIHSSVTPAHSDSDSEDARSHLPATMSSMHVDQDADMAVDSFCSTDASQPSNSLRPDLMAPTAAGRMPTPIHCSFAAQVRGSNWGAVPPVNDGIGATIACDGNGATATATHYYPQQDPSIPRSLNGNVEWSMVQTRRLPSPISENGGEDAPTSPGMVLDHGSPVMMHTMPLHPNIRMSPQPSDTDAAMMDQDDNSPSSAPATPSPRGKYGHSRSKHTLNNWTIQPGMKKSFSIGYRADCEKCRLKIPGHFNHIIIS